MSARNHHPKISVIVATLNSGATLQRCIDSVVHQTYPYRELIIMDGGSIDNSLDILKANDGNITYWESKKDKGVYHAWNKALEHAHGEWIYFLGGDDYLWSPETLSQMVPHLNAAFPAVRIVYGSVAIVLANGDILEVHGRPWKLARKQFLQGKCIPHQGVFHHRSLFELHGGFDSSFKVAGDYEFLLRELKQADAVFVDDIIVAGQQIGGLCSDPPYELLVLKEYITAQEKHFGRRLFLQLWWSYAKATIKRALRSIIGDRNSGYVVDFYRVISGRPAIWKRYNEKQIKILT